MCQGNGRNPRIISSRKGQKSIAARSPGLTNRPNVGVVILRHGVDHTQNFWLSLHFLGCKGSLCPVLRKQRHTSNGNRIQELFVVVVLTPKGSNWFAKLSISRCDKWWWPGISVIIFSRMKHAPKDRHIGNPGDLLCFFVVLLIV